MTLSAGRRWVFALLLVGGTLALLGCMNGNPSYFPYLLPGGPATRSHARPMGPGYFADFDPHACRIELRPPMCTVPVRGAQILIATVYDGAGVPRRGRRVEWMLDGPGSIIEVDESGWSHGRGLKIDNKFAYSDTDYLEHCFTKAGTEITIGPGQTWCVVTSPVEGETVVTAYVPAIADWGRNRAYTRITWTEAGLEFPAPVTARAGTESVLATRVQKSDRLPEGYRVRYRIADGPPAALTTRGHGVDAVTEAETEISDDGAARVTIAQPVAAAGVNRIIIEVMKPVPERPGEFMVVSKGETTVTWQAAEFGVRINVPRTLAINQDVEVVYSLAGPLRTGSGTITLAARIPEGFNLLRTEPKAIIDDSEMIWTLRGGSESVRAVFRPMKIGSTTLTATARSTDGGSTRGNATVNVTEARLVARLTGPTTGMLGETLPFQLSVTNTGDTRIDQIQVELRLAEGLELARPGARLRETIPALAPGQTKTMAVPLVARKQGSLLVEAVATAGNLASPPQSTTIEVQEAQLGLTVHGPSRGYVGEEFAWQLVVRNNGDVPLERVAVRAVLPPDVVLVRATDGGQLQNQQVTWSLGTAPPRQERTVALTVRPERATGKATLTAHALATIARTNRPITPERPATASVEIVGVPAIQVAIQDSRDPIGIGQRSAYSIRVKNTGTAAAPAVEVQAEAAGLVRVVRATGPGKSGTIEGQRVTFPPLATLEAGAEATYVVEVEGLVPGDARLRVEVRSPVVNQPIRAEEPTRILGREGQSVDRREP